MKRIGMRRMVYALSLCAILGTAVLAAEKNKCVCFELKGEFGDEIMAVLQKHMKNLGSDDIEVVKEEVVQPEKQTGFVSSLIGVLDSPGSVASEEGYNLTEGKTLYDKQCSSCHGMDGREATTGGSSQGIAGMNAQKVYSTLFSYRNDNDYSGAARYVKQTIAENLTDPMMRNIAEYVHGLGSSAPASEATSSSDGE